MTAFTLLLTVILLILFFGYKRIPVIARYIGSAGYELKKGWKGGVDGDGEEGEKRIQARQPHREERGQVIGGLCLKINSFPHLNLPQLFSPSFCGQVRVQCLQLPKPFLGVIYITTHPSVLFFLGEKQE